METEEAFHASGSEYLQECKDYCWQEHNNLWKARGSGFSNPAYLDHVHPIPALHILHGMSHE